MYVYCKLLWFRTLHKLIYFIYNHLSSSKSSSINIAKDHTYLEYNRGRFSQARADAEYCRGGKREPCTHASGPASCPCQRNNTQPLKYLTFTIVISQRQELITLNNNKARVSYSDVRWTGIKTKFILVTIGRLIFSRLKSFADKYFLST